MDDCNQEIMGKDWLFAHQLPNGKTPPTLSDDENKAFKAAQIKSIEIVLDSQYQGDWQGVSVADLACQQGFLALHFASKGARVKGFDADKKMVDDANLMAQGMQLSDHFRAKRASVDDMMPEKYGRFDVVLLVGLLYRIENPMAAVRTAYALSKDMCVIETHVLDGQYSSETPQLSVVHAVEEPVAFNNQNSTGLCLVANVKALLLMMEVAGFKNVSVIEPPEDEHQHPRFKKRVMAVGYK